MTLSVLSDASIMVQLHIVFAMVAFPVGVLVLFWLAPGPWHKWLGYLWVASMAGIATTGLFIPSHIPLFGPVSFLHVFSAVTLWSLWRGVRAALAGDFAAHRAYFEGLWFAGLGLAGLASFLPGRMINRSFFGTQAELGFVVIAVGGAGLTWVWLRRNRGALERI